MTAAPGAREAMAGRRWTRRAGAAAVAAMLAALPAASAQPARQLAVDRGCYNCHAEPSRPNIRSFAAIAKAYESLRGKDGAERQARDRMHHGGLFSHVAAHERLSEEEATALVHWLFEGAP